jgi:uncharacterized protein with HEPN domain
MPPDPPDPDEVRIRHMPDAAREAIVFSSGRDRGSLDADGMYRRAVMNCIQEIGEAANRVSDTARASLPAVPWREIVLMRNRLVHVYFNINSDFVWEVISRDLQPLVGALETWLNERLRP